MLQPMEILRSLQKEGPPEAPFVYVTKTSPIYIHANARIETPMVTYSDGGLKQKIGETLHRAPNLFRAGADVCAKGADYGYCPQSRLRMLSSRLSSSKYRRMRLQPVPSINWGIWGPCFPCLCMMKMSSRVFWATPRTRNCRKLCIERGRQKQPNK